MGFGIWVLGCAVVALSACAARRATLPTDPGAPLPDFQQIHAQVSAACSGVRTLTAELGLSGRAADQRLRGRVIAGFERPASMRLEAPAPLGQPVFILAASGTSGTLLLRDGRVVRGAPPDAILDALTGVNLGPADLQALLTGCVVPAPRATAGRMHANGWASIDVESGEAAATPARATIYLRTEAGPWRLRAARREGWRVDYIDSGGRFPDTIRLESQSAGARVDIALTLSQLETNGDIDPAAFRVNEPANARPITLDELRAAGPLQGS